MRGERDTRFGFTRISEPTGDAQLITQTVLSAHYRDDIGANPASTSFAGNSCGLVPSPYVKDDINLGHPC
jgi:hypothetical protein